VEEEALLLHLHGGKRWNKLLSRALSKCTGDAVRTGSMRGDFLPGEEKERPGALILLLP